MKRKNGFFTFCCALIPGAGEMFLGYLKRGLSLMIIFALVAGIAMSYGFEIVAVLLPVIWFYSFFDTFNLKSKIETDENIPADDFLFHLSSNGDLEQLLKKRHKFIGAALIFIGGYTILDRAFMRWLWQISDVFPSELQDLISSVIRSVPTLAVSIAIIYVGMKLVKGPTAKKEISDDYTEYKGDDINE